MITVNNLSISFSGIPLFQNISFVVADNERIALVGKNGVGNYFIKNSFQRITSR